MAPPSPDFVMMLRKPEGRRSAQPPRESLLDYFDAYVRGPSECAMYDDGFRTRSRTYDEVRNAAECVARRLLAFDIHPGECVAICGESRPEWLVAFWGCVLAGAVVVPVDAHASSALLLRIFDVAPPRLVFAGHDPDLADVARTTTVWRLNEVQWPTSPSASADVRSHAGGGASASAACQSHAAHQGVSANRRRWPLAG